MATLEAIMVKVTGMSPQSTGAFKELREKRDAIKAKMSSALIELRNMQVRKCCTFRILTGLPFLRGWWWTVVIRRRGMELTAI